ncbi:MAG TPA: glycosyltransferase [Pyrinomonadaceae bacterium]|nr:glycosyltransferase [Pyrinomonadaceae bacterium]
MERNRTIFFDAKGKRRIYTSRIGIILGFITLVLTIVFLSSIFIKPLIPKIRLKPNQSSAAEYQVDYQKNAQEVAKDEATKRKTVKEEKKQKADAFFATHPQPTPSLKNNGKPLAIGFYVNWDDSSYTSLKRNFNQLDWLVPEWVRLSGDEKNPLVLDIEDENAKKAIELLQQEKPSMPILPLVQNYKNEQWNPQILSKAIETEESRQNLINALLTSVTEHKWGGVTIDLEEVPNGAQSNLFKFIQELHQKFSEKGLIVAQAVPFNNPDWNYKAYAEVTDYLMLMAYDQHWETSEAGPVAGQDWFEDVLKQRMSELSPDKTIVCIGNYGYNWINGARHGEDISFQEAVLAANESLDSPKDIKFDENSKNPHFNYTEDDGKTHTVWFLDAVTAYNEMSSAKPYNVAGYALWRLGSEDPSLWNIFGTDKTLSTDGLESIKYSYDVDFEGTGEILQVRALPQDGVRTLKTDSKNQINESFESVPSSYVMQRTGDQVGKIVLTFDDGPDPEWTPKILDILKEKGIKATFFIIGENGQENPELVKRIVNEGHEIGNHSFTHPNLGEVPQTVTEVELNATQRLIESLTGRSTRLFRAPYFGDAEPRTPNEVEPTVLAQKLGYITVGLHLDPDDWKLNNEDGTPRTADDFVNETLKAASITTPEERGNIVLLHDGGGNRQATVDALPKIIDQLQAKGYQFTTVADLAGITPEQAMPIVPQDQNYVANTNSVVFYGISTGQWLIKWLFLLGIVLGLLRVGVIGILAFIQYLHSRKRDKNHFGETYQPFVSVVVPAFNEEKVICRTIESLLQSNYKNFEIIMVDDGSSDKTFEIASEFFGNYDRVWLYRKENGGKAEALNFGWRHAEGEIIVALDADTIFRPETISELVKRFADKKIGAVAGNAKVGNRINLVTKWQALEYITSQNFDRRAFSLLDCITVVPGSVGAWRRNVLEKAGGFSNDTLAEDQDLTIQVRQLGYEIGYTENAIGLTEAPDSLRGLAKQRFRWSYGTLQCLWKHKSALFNPKYGTLGFIAMPNVWIFQVIFPLISPLMDLMFIWTFLSALLGYLEHQQEYSPTNLTAVMLYYGLFLVVDLLSALFAFCLEKREQKSLLWWLPIQRFGYRQVIYYVMVKSVLTAIRGTIVGWGKLERKATVKV